MELFKAYALFFLEKRKLGLLMPKSLNKYGILACSKKCDKEF
jgi:hypothetical protein